MIDKVNKLFEAIKPLRLAQDLNLKVFEHNEGFYFIRDPKANKKLWYLKDSEFVSPERFPEHKALNIISFIVEYYDKSFEEAVELIFKKYQKKLQNPILEEIKWARVMIAEYLRDLHSINRLLQKGKKNLARDNGYSKCRQLLKKYCEDPNYVYPIVSGVKGSDLNKVFDSLSHLSELRNVRHHGSATKSDFFQDSRFLVIPTYASYGTPTFLRLVNEHTERTVDLNITDHNKGFFGLHSVAPDSSCVYVLPDSSKVMHSARTFFNHGNPVSQSCISVESKDKGIYFPGVFPRGVMVMEEDTKISDILNVQESFRELGVLGRRQLFRAKFDQSIEARTFVINKFLEQDSNDTRTIESIKNEPITYARLKQQLNYLGRIDILTMLDSNTVDSENFVINGNSIIATGDGYIAEKGPRTIQFTNFTISIKEAHIFRESSDIYYTGTVNMAMRSYDFIISKGAITQVRGIISACIYAVTADKNFETNDTSTPTLLDTTFGSTLRNLLSNASARAPVKLGVNKLGWDSTFSRFQAPTWSCSGGEIESKFYFKHPTVKSFRNFDWSKLKFKEKCKIYSNLNANGLIALATSAIIRYYFFSGCKAIRISNTKDNRQLLTAILSIFGQNRTEEINPNLRKSTTLQGIDGYPIVCFCSNIKVLSKINSPSFTLVEKGYSFCAKDVDYGSLTEFCNFYFPNLINYLIRTNGKFITTVSGNAVHDQIQEGLGIMKKVVPDVNWQVSITDKHTVFANWLSKVRYNFSNNVKLDFKNQKIRFVFSPDDVDTCVAIKKYLESIGIETRRPCGKHLIVDYQLTYDVMQEIFINVPEMGTYEEKEPSTPVEEPTDTNEAESG